MADKHKKTMNALYIITYILLFPFVILDYLSDFLEWLCNKMSWFRTDIVYTTFKIIYKKRNYSRDKTGDLADTANKINNEIVEELKSNDICQEYLEDKRKELRLINRDIKTLQSLLDEREDSKDGEG